MPARANLATLTGKIFELRADVAGSLTVQGGGSLANGVSISGWADQSTTGLNVSQATGSKQPTYQSAGLNGNRPALIFVRANITELDAASALWTGDPAFTCYVVGQPSDTSFSTFFSTGTTGTGKAIGFALNRGSAGRIAVSASGMIVQLTSGLKTQMPVLARISKAAGATIVNTTVYVRGIGPKSSTGNVDGTLVVAAGSTKIGTDINGVTTANTYAGPLSHILMLNRVPGLEESAQIEEELMRIWF